MRDARSLSDDALEALRARAVAMVSGGASQVAAARALGVHQNTVSLWLKAWRAAGAEALKAKRRGRRPGEQKRLSVAQERTLQQLITDRCPDQLKLPFALWTREAVRALIAARCGIALVARSRSDLGRALERALSDPSLLERLRRRMHRLARPDASRRGVRAVLERDGNIP